MTEPYARRLNEDQLRAEAARAGNFHSTSMAVELLSRRAENERLRARAAHLEAALREIAKSSTRPGPPDFQYWWDTANDRRDIAKAALSPTPDAEKGEKR